MYKLCPALVVLAACTSTAAPAEPTDPSTSGAVGRLAGILDYVAADYPGTVQGGALTEDGIAGEYEEQRVFLKDAAAMAAELPPPPRPIELAAGLAALQDQVERRVEGAEVMTAARSLRKDLLAAYDVVLAPTVTPSLATGEEQYHACVQCHGVRGAGDGPLAARLEPPPRDFLSPEVMADLSPVRAFNAITDGLPGTKMEAYSTLSASQRWSLAFYIFGFRHDQAAAERGKAAFARTRNALRPTASDLANRNDGDIVATLTAAGLSAAEAGDALAYLRRVAPFETTGAPFDQARRLLATAVSAQHQGCQSDARRAAAAAYLDGFEPHEASLRAIDGALVVRLETEFLGIRAAIADGVAPEVVEQRALRIGVLLDKADG
ncbi:MAG TPA: cytochrome c, partial [Kofleriaceae bacterium]|nr:cytochrome c [Kofleriaceae bacterium]